MAMNQLEEKGYVVIHQHGGYAGINGLGNYSLAEDEFTCTVFETKEDAEEFIKDAQLIEVSIVPAHKIIQVSIG